MGGVLKGPVGVDFVGGEAARFVLDYFADVVGDGVLEHAHCEVRDDLGGEREVVCADGLSSGCDDMCVHVVAIGALGFHRGVVDQADDARGEGGQDATAGKGMSRLGE